MTKHVARSKTHCPNCNSLQKFTPKTTVWEDDSIGTSQRKMIRVFIRCGMCHWEAEAFSGLFSVWKARSDMATLRTAALRHPINQVLIDRIAARS